jgi:outer membrane protein assembly complex protein YaeT
LINTGKRHSLEKVEISGNRYFTEPTIRERLFLIPASLLQFRHGRYSESLRRRDEDSIRNLYASNGFRDVVVTSTTQDNYKGKEGDVAVFFKIEEGPQYFVAHLDIQGMAEEDRKQVLPRLSSIEGQPFSEFNVAVDRDLILNHYFANGYPSASFTWYSRAASQPHQFDVMYTVNPGEQQFVREVLVSGMQATRPGLVHRNLDLQTGDALSPIEMTDTQRKLYDLGVFAKVDMAIQNPEGETDRKYVLYQLEEASRYSITGGLGAEVAKIGGCQTCLDAPAGQAGFAPRVSFDVTRMNMFGLGHSLSFRSRVSTLQKRGLLNYSAPRYRNKEGLNLSFTALYDDSRDVRTFSSKRAEASVQLSQRLSKATTALYGFSYRRVSVAQSTLKISPLLVPLLSQPVRVGILSSAIVQDRRDDPTDSHKGAYNTIDLGLASRYFGSQKDFLRLLLRNSTYYQIGKRLVLARSTQLGVINPFRLVAGETDLTAIPLPERFFSGGATTHRGFPENQAGPRDLTTGFPLGGNALLMNNVELRFPLIGENIGGVLYHDAGNVYSSLSKVSFRFSQRDLKDFDYMVHAVGFGVRYRTPIGPVRADIGWSINSPRFIGFNGTQSDLFNAGVDPCAPVIDPNHPGGPPVTRCTEQRISRFQFHFSIGQTF